jgi:hypothetical protein
MTHARKTPQIIGEAMPDQTKLRPWIQGFNRNVARSPSVRINGYKNVIQYLEGWSYGSRFFIEYGNVRADHIDRHLISTTFPEII